MPQQHLHLGSNPELYQTAMHPDAVPEYYAVDRGSNSSLDFSQTLPAAAAGNGSKTPRMLSQASMQAALQYQHQHQPLPSGRDVSGTRPTFPQMASDMSGVAPQAAGALQGRAAEALRSSFYSPAGRAAAAAAASPHARDRPQRLNEDPMAAAAAAYLQDGNLRRQRTSSLSMSIQQQQQQAMMMMTDMNDAAASGAQAMPANAGRKPRRASCCVVPDSGYQQRLMQLHQLYQEERLLQEELRDSITQMGQVDQAAAAGLGFAQQRQDSLAMQQQLQWQQQQQQQQAAAGAAAAARRRRASMSVTSGTAYLQQQQQMMQGRPETSMALDQAMPAARGRMQVDGLPACTRHASIELSRSSRAAAAMVSSSFVDDRGLQPQLQVLLQQQKQEAAAAAGYSCKPRRASVAVLPDSSYHAKLQQLQLQMQEQQLVEQEAAAATAERLAAEQALRALLPQPLQQPGMAASGRKQRRASLCVLPSAVTSRSQQLGGLSSSLHAAADQGVMPYGQTPSFERDLAVPAARRFNDMSMQGTSSASAALPAAPYMPAAPLVHAGSGSSSASSSSMQVQVSPELSISQQGSYSANNSMEDATAGFSSEMTADQYQQQQQMLLQHAQRARRGGSAAALSSSSMGSLTSSMGAMRPGLLSEPSAALRVQHAGSMEFVQRQLSSGSYTSYASDDTMDTTGSNPGATAADAAAASRHASASYTSSATPFAAAVPVDVLPDGSPAGPGSVTSAGGSLTASLSQSMSEDQASALSSLHMLQGELQQLLELKRTLAAAAAAAKAGTVAAAAVKAAQRKNAETIQSALAAKVALEAAASRSSAELEEMLGGRQLG
jgi:hypothetical protein